MREVDEEFIYGNYTCRATNQMGVGTHFVVMRRASKNLFVWFKYIDIINVQNWKHAFNLRYVDAVGCCKSTGVN